MVRSFTASCDGVDCWPVDELARSPLLYWVELTCELDTGALSVLALLVLVELPDELWAEAAVVAKSAKAPVTRVV